MSHFASPERHMVMNKASKGPSTIVIVGAGYAGIAAANRAARTHRVVLVNERPDFVDRIRLHQHLATGREVRTPLTDMVRRGVRVVVARVEGIGDGVVTLADGSRIDADHVVVASGSGAGVGTLPWAEDARRALGELPTGGNVTILGGGLTGIETATEIAEAHPGLSVSLVDRSRIGGNLSPAAERHLRGSLDRLGVATFEGGRLPAASDLTIDCSGLTVAPLAAASGLPVDESGRLRVDRTLRVPGTSRVWGVGDAAVVDGAPHLRMSCAAAQAMVPHLVAAIRAVDAGRTPASMDVGFAARCISLGRKDGLVQLVRGDDSPTTAITGSMGAVTKELICHYAWGCMTWLSRLFAAPRGPRAATMREAEAARG